MLAGGDPPCDCCVRLAAVRADLLRPLHRSEEAARYHGEVAELGDH
jgi:hypothetical protein